MKALFWKQYVDDVMSALSKLRGCLYGEGPALLVGLALVRRLDFTSRQFTWEKPALLPGLARLAESPGLTTFIFQRNPESDICVQVFILYPTHKQTELVK